MGRHQTVISTAIYSKAKTAIKETKALHIREYTRLKAIISAKENGINLAAKILQTSAKTIRVWAKRFKSEGIEGLKYKTGRGRKSKVLQPMRNEIMKWISKDSSITLKEIVLKLRESFNINSSISAVHRIVTSLKFAYITPRPIHYKQNKKSQNDFKKKSCCNIKANQIFIFLMNLGLVLILR